MVAESLLAERSAGPGPRFMNAWLAYSPGLVFQRHAPVLTPID